MIACVGNGLVGSCIQETVSVDRVYTSANITDATDTLHDIVYCAAPSANRIWVTENANRDWLNVEQIIANIRTRRLVLFSTCDTQIKPNTVYAQNRLRLEQWASEYKDSTIIRLPMLIHKRITKNILYDIKHSTWLDKINPNSKNQWFDLECLPQYIGTQDREINLCSEPISNSAILSEFAPYVTGNPELPEELYNLKPYRFTQEQIFKSMRTYL